jgi:hypothetical protein
METTNVVPRELVCYGPKPAHRTIPTFEQLVRLALKNARGIYQRRGMTCAEITIVIRRLAVTHLGSDAGVSIFRVASALAKLHRRGMVTNDGQTPCRWRIA